MSLIYLLAVAAPATYFCEKATSRSDPPHQNCYSLSNLAIFLVVPPIFVFILVSTYFWVHGQGLGAMLLEKTNELKKISWKQAYEVIVKKINNTIDTLCICNSAESSITRNSDLIFLTHAGPEIGVASTKTFTTQLVALALLTCSIGVSKETISKKREKLMEQFSRVEIWTLFEGTKGTCSCFSKTLDLSTYGDSSLDIGVFK